jgi:hypothetical protein
MYKMTKKKLNTRKLKRKKPVPKKRFLRGHASKNSQRKLLPK